MPIVDGRHAAILSLQRAAGNRAVANLVRQREGGNITAATLARAPEAPEAEQRPFWKRWADKASAWSKTSEIAPYAKAKAKELITKAKEAEPRVTGHVRAIAFSRRGRAKGLEYRIKSEESLARKIADQAAEHTLSTLAPAKAVQQVGELISDTLRYTIILAPDATYGHLFQEISETMQKFNFSPNLRKNYWEKSTTYKGVNLTFKTADVPPLGFEVQLHTEESFATKQLNHHEYEEARAVGTSDERKKLLDETMEDRWMAVKVPEGFSSAKPSRVTQ